MKPSLPSVQKSAWQMAMVNAVTQPEVLIAHLKLDPQLLVLAQKAAQLFGLRVPLSFIERMEKGNPRDPLLLQVLPLQAELKEMAGFMADPLHEKKFNVLPGVLHKYHGRVLVMLTGSCGIHCRYCFRREFPYESNNPGKKGWDNIFAYLSENLDISEVILSGGDPLNVSDSLLKAFCEKLLTLSHIKTLRIHSRMPIVVPERVTEELVDYFREYPLHKIMVLHTNHPQEINGEVIAALNQLSQANMVLLNQSVLLKDINDNARTLIKLSETLWQANVLPYYLHLLDKVSGTAHFNVEKTTAKRVLKTLQENLPGYLVPKLVREVPGEKHKILV